MRINSTLMLGFATGVAETEEVVEEEVEGVVAADGANFEVVVGAVDVDADVDADVDFESDDVSVGESEDVDVVAVSFGLGAFGAGAVNWKERVAALALSPASVEEEAVDSFSGPGASALAGVPADAGFAVGLNAKKLLPELAGRADAPP